MVDDGYMRANNNTWRTSTTNTVTAKGSILVIDEDTEVKIGDRSMTGKQLIRILTLSERMVKDKYPEEFI